MKQIVDYNYPYFEDSGQSCLDSVKDAGFVDFFNYLFEEFTYVTFIESFAE